ncbi:hypothetical protein, variant 4 [Aphanomyces invadans]|uniref:Kinesin motor domain-containing protein n=1 Tax=Aphanomyces invadans TaxID=157072 RepID=A0A024UX67_9STRA|nr:hypothetical protein, variant 3 [Aphanomyces invadans]XP_008861951.1 hypothetical protein, variant 4 [Aphanomyces invadans]ETW10541.1 hypothetical protein, variant 3 [Aphanomyces invadans]ETW10542.1 hypothetical protein, variant 4 [Aphanomyces invadans]|eukprot:XP_008861950.1 hypothetical protein, variant 3 [Aphanomyces invadans]
MKSKIRVVVRVRPQLPAEKTHSCETLQLGNHTVRLGVTDSSQKEFRFDHVLGPSATQKEVYDTAGVAQSIASVLEGYHATLFAYGQTGSGKTYTMEGFEYERIASKASERASTKAKIDVASDRLGIVPRVILELFDALKTAAVIKNKAYRVKSSFVQIYNEQILDLFNPSSKQCLKLRWAADQEFFVEDLTMVDSASGEEMLLKFTEGVKDKIMATTNMNAASSRSHCIYTIYVESIDLENPSLVTTTKLCLVDLAGSERIVKTGATGVTLQESIGINKSLFVLRQVIQVLSDEANMNPTGQNAVAKTHVPYRDSKLTSLLKHSLGGNSITVMIVCLSPSDLCYEENLSTLQYAARAQQISNTPVKNAGEAHKVLVQQLRDTIQSLHAQLAEANATIERLQQRRPKPLRIHSGASHTATTSHPALPNDTKTTTQDDSSNQVEDDSDGESSFVYDEIARPEAIVQKAIPPWPSAWTWLSSIFQAFHTRPTGHHAFAESDKAYMFTVHPMSSWPLNKKPPGDLGVGMAIA